MWSIGTELQLYAVYLLLLLIMGKFGWRHGLVAMLVFEIFSNTIGFGIAEDKQSLQLFALSNSPFAYWFSWAIGAHVAENAINKRRESFGWVDFRWLIFLNLLAFLFAPLSLISFPLFALTTAVAIDRAIANRWHAIKFPLSRAVWNHLTWLGIISYSLYFVHQSILTQAGYFLRKLGLRQHSLDVLMITCLVLYPAIITASFGLYRLIEVPFIRLGSGLWKQRKVHWTPQRS
jgi:peptidoglycan/LPS O-acetylase OafA/YrhL